MAETWFRSRHYVHFDLPLSKAEAIALVTSPQRVASHGFYPLLTFYKSRTKVRRDKATGKLRRKVKPPRPLRYCAHSDSHIYAYYCARLTPLYEAELERQKLGSAVLAFRKGKGNNVDFALAAFDEIRRRGDCQAIALDIEGFFDNLDHGLLKAEWSKLVGRTDGKLPPDHYKVFRSITRYSSVDTIDLEQKLGISRTVRQSKKFRLCEPDYFRDTVRALGLIKVNGKGFGVPQGSPISAFLSNVYMLDFDTRIKATVEAAGGRYMRYCDDILVIADAARTATLTTEIEDAIRARRLTIQGDKTQISNFHRDPSNGEIVADKPLQYLGFTFDGARVLIRSGSLARYHNRLAVNVKMVAKIARSRNRARIARGEAARPIYLRKLYARFAPVNQLSFLTYGYRAADKMDARSIRRQLRRYLPLLQRKIAGNDPEAT